MVNVLGKILGDSNERVTKKFRPAIEEVNSFEPEMVELSNDQLADKTPEFRERLADGWDLDELIPEAYAWSGRRRSGRWDSGITTSSSWVGWCSTRARSPK